MFILKFVKKIIVISRILQANSSLTLRIGKLRNYETKLLLNF